MTAVQDSDLLAYVDRLKDKVLVITGASHSSCGSGMRGTDEDAGGANGIGKQTVLDAAKHGCVARELVKAAVDTSLSEPHPLTYAHVRIHFTRCSPPPSRMHPSTPYLTKCEDRHR